MHIQIFMDIDVLMHMHLLLRTVHKKFSFGLISVLFHCLYEYGHHTSPVGRKVALEGHLLFVLALS